MTDLKPEDLATRLARVERLLARAIVAANSSAPVETHLGLACEFIGAREDFLSLLADRARMEKALRRLLSVAEIMPRRTPAPGGCSTVHTFALEAGTVWENDIACEEANLALGASPDGK